MGLRARNAILEIVRVQILHFTVFLFYLSGGQKGGGGAGSGRGGAHRTGWEKRGKKRKKKSVKPVTLTAAMMTIHSMSAKLNNCMIKVVQLEELDDDQIELVQELKSNLENLNKEKDILLNHFQQASSNSAQEVIAEV